MRHYNPKSIWMPVLNDLYESQYANQMVCSMSTQLFHLPISEDLKKVNRDMHKYLVDASYHRSTAIGSLNRLLYGDLDHSIVATAVACIQNAKKADQQVSQGLKKMVDVADPRYKPFIEIIIRWQEASEAYLLRVKNELIRVVGYDTWKKLQQFNEH